jgi:hypothetical protein
MDSPVPDYPDDVTVYLVVNDFGKFGKAFVETDIAEADREAIIRSFISGQYSNALRVVAFNTAEGWSRDVSEDIANEVLERAFDGDENFSEDTSSRARSDRRRHRCGVERRSVRPCERRARDARPRLGPESAWLRTRLMMKGDVPSLPSRIAGLSGFFTLIQSHRRPRDLRTERPGGFPR